MGPTQVHDTVSNLKKEKEIKGTPSTMIELYSNGHIYFNYIKAALKWKIFMTEVFSLAIWSGSEDMRHGLQIKACAFASGQGVENEQRIFNPGVLLPLGALLRRYIVTVPVCITNWFNYYL